MSEEERLAIVAARQGGASIDALKEKFRRGHPTIRNIVDAMGTSPAANEGHDPAKALVLTHSPTTKDAKPTKKKPGRPRKLDDLALINKQLENSMTSVLEQPLDRFIEIARKALPHAHTITIDLINRRAKALVAQEVDLFVGGPK